jgi:hypothetical protein
MQNGNSVAFDPQKFLVAKLCQGARKRFTGSAHFGREYAFGAIKFNFDHAVSNRLATASIDREGRIDKIWRGNAWTPEELIAEIKRLE